MRRNGIIHFGGERFTYGEISAALLLLREGDIRGLKSRLGSARRVRRAIALLALGCDLESVIRAADRHVKGYRQLEGEI